MKKEDMDKKTKIKKPKANKEIKKAKVVEKVTNIKKKINLPNILTIIRILFVPVFVVLMALNDVWEYMKYISLGIYVIASFTDYLDGYIARKKGIVTTFGKLMDPLADKILVSSGFIMLTGMGMIPAWITVIIVSRDFLLNTLRMFGTAGGETIAAGSSGKIKTAFQMIGVSLAIIDTNGLFAFVATGTRMELGELSINAIMSVSITVAVIFTIWSCIEYFVKFRKYIDITK